uniref:Uncharacterized protein n=1 Tax=Coccolithus braarudii TaxID=221442 RepID=A0A7S0Q5W5_9EUKA
MVGVLALVVLCTAAPAQDSAVPEEVEEKPDFLNMDTDNQLGELDDAVDWDAGGLDAPHEEEEEDEQTEQGREVLDHEADELEQAAATTDIVSFMELEAKAAKKHENFSHQQLIKLKNLRWRCNRAKKRRYACIRKPTSARRINCKFRRNHEVHKRCGALKAYATRLYHSYKKCAAARAFHRKHYSWLATKKKIKACEKRPSKLDRKMCRHHVVKARAKSVKRAWKVCRKASLHHFYVKLQAKITKNCNSLDAAFKGVFGGNWTVNKNKECHSLYATPTAKKAYGAEYPKLLAKCIAKHAAEKKDVHDRVTKCRAKESALRNAYSTYQKATAHPQWYDNWKRGLGASKKKCKGLSKLARMTRRQTRRDIKKKCFGSVNYAAIKKCMAPYIAKEKAAKKAAKTCWRARKKLSFDMKLKKVHWENAKRAAISALKPYIRSFEARHASSLKDFIAKERRLRAARAKATRARLAREAAHHLLLKTKAHVYALQKEVASGKRREAHAAHLLTQQKKDAANKMSQMRHLYNKMVSRHNAAVKVYESKLSLLRKVLTSHGWHGHNFVRKNVCKPVPVCKTHKQKTHICSKLMLSAATVKVCAVHKTKAAKHLCASKVYTRCMAKKHCHNKTVCKNVLCHCHRRTFKSCMSSMRQAARTKACHLVCKGKKGAHATVCMKKCKNTLFNACRKKSCVCGSK